jgi:hypothetical protein
VYFLLNRTFSTLINKNVPCSQPKEFHCLSYYTFKPNEAKPRALIAFAHMFSEFKKKCSSDYLCPQGVVLGSKQMSRQICTRNNPQIILQHHQEHNHRSNHNQMNPPYRTRKLFPEPIHTWKLARGICLHARPGRLLFPHDDRLLILIHLRVLLAIYRTLN